MFDIVGIEMPCMDLLANVDVFPEPNHGTLVNRVSWQGGGKVATGMVAAARLGAVCAMMGGVGDDDYGRTCLWDFQRHGINTDRMLIRQNASTSLSIVISDRATKGRSILFHRGSAPNWTPEEIDESVIRSSRFFFFAHLNEPMTRFCRVARESGAETFMDVDQYSEDTIRNIELIDYFIASEFVYNRMFSDENFEVNCRSVMALGPKVVVFTLGGRGCVGVSGQGFFQLETYPVDVVDTVGAGDVFHGAFLAGLLKGWSHRDCADFANAVSSIKVTRPGGRAGIPDMETARHFMKTGEIRQEELDQRTREYERGLQHE